MSVLLDTDPVVIEQLEFEVACESIHHDSGKDDHGGPATHLQIGCCEFSSGFRCCGYVAACLANPDERSWCGGCNCVGTNAELVFIPIGVHS